VNCTAPRWREGCYHHHGFHCCWLFSRAVYQSTLVLGVCATDGQRARCQRDHCFQRFCFHDVKYSINYFVYMPRIDGFSSVIFSEAMVIRKPKKGRPALGKITIQLRVQPETPRAVSQLRASVQRRPGMQPTRQEPTGEQTLALLEFRAASGNSEPAQAASLKDFSTVNRSTVERDSCAKQRKSARSRSL